MKISTLKNTMLSYLEERMDPDLFFDPGNNPFVNISISYLSEGEWREESFCSYVRLRGKPKSSTYDYRGCLSVSKILQATYLDSEEDGSDGEKNDYGYCSGLFLNNDCFVVISVVASPEDSIHIFKTVRNKLKILCEVN